MRTVKYTEWQTKRLRSLRTRAQLGATRGTSVRPRDQAERQLLTKLDKERLEAWQKTGRLIRVAPRRYKINTSVSA